MRSTGAPSETAPVAERSRRAGPFRRAADIWRFRELLANLVRKELKVKYKNSALGFVWSLLNPALYLVVFYLVFQIVFRTGMPYFAIFFLAGLLPWNLFNTALSGATTSMVANAGLVKKVWFPREVLPLASIGAGLVHFFLQFLVLVAALALFGQAPSWRYALLVIPALACLLLLLTALCIGLSAVNVYLRDTQHLLDLTLLAWFWATPIVYEYQRLTTELGRWRLLALFNPLTSIVIAFQRGIYGRVSYIDPGTGVTQGIVPDASWLWYLRNLGLVVIGSMLLIILALWVFGRLEDNLAEEL